MEANKTGCAAGGSVGSVDSVAITVRAEVPHHPSIVYPKILGGAKAHRSHPARANIQRLMITMTKAVI